MEGTGDFGRSFTPLGSIKPLGNAQTAGRGDHGLGTFGTGRFLVFDLDHLAAVNRRRLHRRVDR
jgi:hypothetical protein